MSRERGSEAEKVATNYLKEKGFKIVNLNFHSRFGEIDIIAYKDKVWHFIEVKSGKGEPIYQITPKKLSKILKTVDIYLQKHKIEGDYFVDALIVQNGECEFVENITF